LWTVDVHVLKVRGKENLQELDEVIGVGHTVSAHGLGSWQMPRDAEPGDLAVWYAGDPDQQYVAYGWVAEAPNKPASEKTKYYGPVAGVRELPSGRRSRRQVAEACGFNDEGVAQLAQTIKDNCDGFLLALGFDRRFVSARELISGEVASVLR
jgi:hypothetical protein